MFASTLPNFLRKSSLIKCLKELTLVADFQLSGRLVQVLNPTYDKLWIHSFVFRKGSFNFLLEERVITPFSPTGQKSSSK